MFKKLLASTLAGCMVIGSLAACGSTDTAAQDSAVKETEAKTTESVSEPAAEKEAEAAKGEPTNLILFNVCGDLAEDHEEVWGKINEILTEKINVTVEYRNITWAEYDQKYPMIISSGEQVDILYCMNGTWQNYVEKGAFMDLTELAPVYAPNLLRAYSEDQIQASTMDDKLWIMPPNYSVQVINGVAVRGDLMDKYGIEEIKNADDFVDYLTAVYENEEGFTLFQDNSRLIPTGSTGTVGEWSALGGTSNLFFFNGSEGADYTDIRLPYEIDRQIADWEAVSRAYEAGVVPKDVLMTQVVSHEAFAEGTLPAACVNTGNFSGTGVWGKIMEEHPEWDVRWYCFDPEISPVVSPIANGWVIPATAKNPELSLQVMELLAMDEELNRLVNYGIEGKHYVINEDGQRDLPEGVTAEERGYNGYGSIHWSKEFKLADAGTWPEYESTLSAYVDRGHISPLNGFSPDFTAVETELANMTALWSEYVKSLDYGVLPVSETIEEVKSAMEAAGAEKVREEIKAQIAAFLAE